MHGERKKRKSKQASEKKPACMQAKNHKEKKEIAKKFLTLLLYTHVIVQLSRHRRVIFTGVFVREYVLVQLIGLSFFYSFSILQGDLDSFVRHFSPFYDHFLYMLILQRKKPVDVLVPLSLP